MRSWRPDHPLTGDALVKARARAMAGEYQRRGKLVPKPCEQCGSKKNVERHHHRGYDNPLDVIYLCRRCHLAEHSKETSPVKS
jgi:DNA-directed RNA polymerase subunit M/transcription elongation factor TFIIS